MGEVWTANDIPDQAGRTAVVTGANSGVGLEVARELAHRGALVVLACRDLTRAVAAQRRLQSELPGARAEIMELDLAGLASVHRFAERFREGHQRLDLLVNNAGVILLPYGQSDDGIERHIAVNHLGHFALTGLLVDLLTATPGSRVVTVSSSIHRSVDADFTHMMSVDGDGYSRRRAYARSKLANLLFAYELQRRLATRGAPTVSLAAHPGHSRTGLGRHLEDSLAYRLTFACLKPILQSPAMGALPVLRAATDPRAEGGELYGPAGFRQWIGHPVRVTSSPASHSRADAAELWRLSEELTGIELL